MQVICQDLNSCRDLQELSVYNGRISKEDVSNAIAIIGKIDIEVDSLTFVPLVPFSYSRQYTVLWNHNVLHFEIEPPDDYTYLKIEKIYPSVSMVPQNILKWYFQFNKRVSTTNIYNHISVVDENEKPIERAILPLENALTSADGTLLTMWIEPGRQKRGLGPNRILGPVFKEGLEYKIIISGDVKDMEGVPMNKPVQHKFIIGKADRHKPNPSTWQITPPQKNTIDFLTIRCSESLDYGSTIDAIRIKNSEGIVQKGRWHLSDSESILQFKPDHKWQTAKFVIEIESKIEDLAGNNVNHLFDRPLQDEKYSKNKQGSFQLEFTIK